MTYYEEFQLLNKYRIIGPSIELFPDTLGAHLRDIKLAQEKYPYHDFELEFEMEQDNSCAAMCGLTGHETLYPVLYLKGTENHDSILNGLQNSLLEFHNRLAQEIMEMRCLEEENPK